MRKSEHSREEVMPGFPHGTEGIPFDNQSIPSGDQVRKSERNREEVMPGFPHGTEGILFDETIPYNDQVREPECTREVMPGFPHGTEGIPLDDHTRRDREGEGVAEGTRDIFEFWF